MSKQPDLSAFPIPRKGGARPIALEGSAAMTEGEPDRAGEGAQAPVVTAAPQPVPPARVIMAVPSMPAAAAGRTAAGDRQPGARAASGRVVATTVKLDEDRYLRLAEAGRPAPGRMMRRTIQDMVIEALDEWFERRSL